MPDNAGRDPAEVAETLSAWLATKLLAGADPEVADVNAPAANGFSNETILCRADVDGRRAADRPGGSSSASPRLVTSCSSTPTSRPSTAS